MCARTVMVWSSSALTMIYQYYFFHVGVPQNRMHTYSLIKIKLKFWGKVSSKRKFNTHGYHLYDYRNLNLNIIIQEIIYTHHDMHMCTCHMHTCMQNVVVVGQPSAPPPTVVHRTRRRENDYLVFTLVLLILCFLHGNILALLLLIPALICSVSVSYQIF